ncbi:hypothetical protein ACQPUX_01625, partial [Acinetobacter baumannii]
DLPVLRVALELLVLLVPQVLLDQPVLLALRVALELPDLPVLRVALEILVLLVPQVLLDQPVLLA